MKSFFSTLFAVSFALVIASGCNSTGGTRDDQQASTATTQQSVKVRSITGDFDGEIVGTINPKSKFSKLSIGMSKRQVDDLIGMANDQSGHISGKAFIPFYFGRDAYRTEYYYKGEGSLTFAAGGLSAQGERLLKIVAEPRASGYASGNTTDTTEEAAPVPVAADASTAAVKNGELVGKVYKNARTDLEKSFKIARGISFGKVAAFDVSNKAGRRVVVLCQQGEEKWVVTGDMTVKTATKSLALVGTADEDDTGDGDPKTTCFKDGKEVQAFGFLRASKNKFDQPAGSLAWVVDNACKPAPVTKLVCKF